MGVSICDGQNTAMKGNLLTAELAMIALSIHPLVMGRSRRCQERIHGLRLETRSTFVPSNGTCRLRTSEAIHQLGHLLALQHRDYGTSLEHTQKALHYGEIARDVNLQIASLARRACVYSYMRRHMPKLLANQEALRLCDHCSPLLRGYVYAGLAETYADCGDESRAGEFLQRAREHYPDSPEDDPVYPYTHFRWATFHTFAGKIYLHLHQPRQAWEAFASVEQLVPINEEPYRVALLVNQATTALALEQLEQSCTLLTTAAKAARALGSDLCYDEAYIVYEQMQEKWGQEPPVKTLAHLFIDF
jgi:tetratricopeptide (TPR) repeat protein